MPDADDPLACVIRLVVAPDDIQILIPVALAPEQNELPPGVSIRTDAVQSDQLRITLPLVLGGKNRCSHTATLDQTAESARKKADTPDLPYALSAA